MRILYVEDDATQAQTVEAMLEGEDHFCHTTDSGEQAVLLAKRNEYDMIILDIMLPDIDGYEVIQRMQAAGITTPCLIQSGFVDFDELLERLESTIVCSSRSTRSNCSSTWRASARSRNGRAYPPWRKSPTAESNPRLPSPNAGRVAESPR